MYRNIIEDLIKWAEGNNRQILYIKGAYGVGKTWTVKDFATAFYPFQCYVDASEGLPTDSTELDKLLISRFSDEELQQGLIIFDEVQNIPHVAEFFYEYAKTHRKYSICLIASTMNITEFEYSHGDAFKMIRMRPMSFEEYMIASKAHPFIEAIRKNTDKALTVPEENAIKTMLKEYLLVGGMPGVVSEFIKKKDYTAVRARQEKLIESFEKILKESFPDAMFQRSRRVFRSIPKQLSKDNKKFMYKVAEANARSREYAEATQNLCDLGFARKLPRLMSGKLPLEENVDYKSFELFLLDHGLLRAMYKLPINDDLTLEDILSEKEGAVCEQYLFEELSESIGIMYYWISGATARVPFVYEGKTGPVPVDVRFVNNPKAQNIKVFAEKNEGTKLSVRITLDQPSMDGDCMSIPAYGLWNL